MVPKNFVAAPLLPDSSAELCVLKWKGSLAGLTGLCSSCFGEPTVALSPDLAPSTSAGQIVRSCLIYPPKDKE